MQVFDGITAAVLSVMVPLIVADVAYGSGHFNLAQGVVGTATGIGASLSTVLAGYISDTLRQQHSLHRVSCDRGPRPCDDLAVHAGDAANGLSASRVVDSAAMASDAPTPATQALHPKRSNSWPRTALPTRPPRK